MKTKKSTLYGIATIVLVVLLGNMLMAGGNTKSSGKVNVGSGDFQEIVVGMKDYNYYPNTVNVKSGEPVRMYLDESVGGCFRDLTIRDIGARKYLASPSDYLEFQIDEPGSYRFACSMGMGYGTLIVE